MLKLSVILQAVDRVTKPLGDIAKRVRRLNDDLGLSKLVGAGQRVGSAFGKVAKETREMAVRTVAAAGIIGGGLFALVKRSADLGDAANDMAQRAGIGVVAWQQLAYAADFAGSNQEDLAGGMRNLNRQVVTAAKGNKASAAAFKALGINVKDANGKLKPTEKIFAEMADKFKTMPDGAKKSALAMTLLGRSGTNLIQLLNGGSDGFAEMTAEGQKLGNFFSEEGARNAAKFNDGFDRMMKAVQGLQIAIAEKLMPVLAPLIGEFTEWIAANRQWIATKIGDFVAALPGRIKDVRDSVAALLGSIRPIISAFQTLVEWIGPANAAFIALGGIIAGKLLVSLAQLTLAFGGLGKAMASTALGLAKFALAPLIQTVGAFITALRMGTGVVAAFNIALTANPIGLVITAVAALAAAAYLIYENWEPISAWFTELWAGIKATFSTFVDWVEKGFTEAVIGAFRAMWDFIKPIVEKIEAGFNIAKSAVQGLKSFGGGIMESFSGASNDAGKVGAARAAAVPVGRRDAVDVGGTMQITVSDDRTRVSKARPNDVRNAWDVDTGWVMP